MQSKLPDVGTTIFTVMSKMANDHSAINLSQGFPDFPIDQKLIELTNKAMLSGANQYAPMPGLPILRENLAAKVEKLYHLKVNADDEVTITSGATEALFCAITAVVESGDEVIVFEPAYDSYHPVIELCGGKIVPVELSAPNYQIPWDEVRDKTNDKTKLIIINTPQNPTGTIMSVNKRKALIELSKKFEIPIFEDDCYADLIFDKERPPAIKSYDNEGYVIYCGSFSKSIAPALRVGYLVADWNVLSRILPYKTDAGSGSLEQMALAEFCKNNFDSHTKILRKELKKKSDAICNALDKYFGSAADYTKPDGGIFVWVDLPNNVDTARLYELALKDGVAINPGNEWSINSSGEHKIRLCFGNPSIEEIDEGIKLLAEICQKEFGIPLQIANT